jgi:protein ImuB
MKKAGKEFPSQPGQPFALLSDGPEGLRLFACDGFAQARGLEAGQKLTDARAVAPDLATYIHEPETDAGALLALARWAERFSPWVAEDGCDGLLFDIAGVAHLFGGEPMLLADMRQRFRALGFTVKTGVAPFIGAAFALARFGGDLPQSDDVRANLAPLGVAALRIGEKDIVTLRRLGLKTIGSLYEIPRESLARRFREIRGGSSADVLKRLDEALGLADEPLSPLRPLAAFSVRHAVADPMRSPNMLEEAANDLIHRLCRKLARAGRGAMRLSFAFFRADGTRAVIGLGMSRPSQDPLHMMRLLRPKLDMLDAGFGIDGIHLEAEETGPAESEEPGFMEGAAPFHHDFDLAALSDRLSNRAAEAGLAQLSAVSSHMPERAESFTAFSATATQMQERENIRPTTLLSHAEPISVMASVPDGPPLRFTWRRMAHKVARCEGPERIEPEWWREREGATARPRDYYIVEDEEGRRFWLYREGLYGEAQQPCPQWFMHGLFA